MEDQSASMETHADSAQRGENPLTDSNRTPDRVSESDSDAIQEPIPAPPSPKRPMAKMLKMVCQAHQLHLDRLDGVPVASKQCQWGKSTY